jgi:hypothetical protein
MWMQICILLVGSCMYRFPPRVSVSTVCTLSRCSRDEIKVLCAVVLLVCTDACEPCAYLVWCPLSMDWHVGCLLVNAATRAHTL